MNIKSLTIAIVTSAILSACAGNQGPRIETKYVSTPYILKKKDAIDEIKMFPKGSIIVERDIRMTSLATLDADINLDPSKPKLKLTKGTTLFAISEGMGMNNAQNMLEILNKVSTQAKAAMKEKGRELTKEEREALFKEIMKNINSDVEKASVAQFYCGLTDNKFGVQDFFNAGFSLGVSLLTKKMPIAHCLEDSDHDGKFDKVWKANMIAGYPPAINRISAPHTVSTPVGFQVIKQDDITSIGSLWIQNNGRTLSGRKHIFLVRLGKKKDFILLNGNTVMVQDKTFPQKRGLFGATYEILSYKDGIYEIRIIDDGKAHTVNLNQTVTYR